MTFVKEKQPNAQKKERKAVSGPVAMQRKMRASADKEMLRAQLAVPDRTGGHEAPRIVVVVSCLYLAQVKMDIVCHRWDLKVSENLLLFVVL